MARKESTTGQDGADGIENYELPKALVMRIAKSALPENTKLQKESVLALIKSSTVFINYIAAAAQEIAQARSHKTIAATDILKALEVSDFGDMVPELQRELEIYREESKKGGAVPAKKAPVVPAPSKKGKEKAVGTPPSRARSTRDKAASKGSLFTSAPLPNGTAPTTSVFSVETQPPEVNGAHDEEEEPAVFDEEEEIEDEEEDEDEDIQEEVQEEEPLEDRMALDEAEIAKDAKGLESQDPVTVEES